MSDRRAELSKLARVLDLEPNVLAQLPLEASALRTVRESLSASLFDASRPTLQRVAKASKLLPNGTVARVGEQVFGPLLCARIVGLLAPERAVDLALRMPDEFLADTSAQLDPRQARELVSALPTDRVVAVAGLLVTRNDFVTLARFVDYLSRDTIQAVIDSTADELALLHIATFVDSTSRLTELVELIPRERLRAMVAAVGVHGGELWIEALALANALDGDWKQAIGDIAAELDAPVIEGMVATACDFEAWEYLLPLVAAMSEHTRARFLELAELMPTDLLRRLVTLVAALPLDPIGQQLLDRARARLEAEPARSRSFSP